MRLVKAVKMDYASYLPQMEAYVDWPCHAPPPGGGYRMELRVATVPAHLRLPHLAVVCCDVPCLYLTAMERERIILPTAVVGAMYQQCSSGTMYR